MNRSHPIRTKSPVARNGTSLIEVVVLATIASVLLVMVTRWVHHTMTQSAQFRDEHRQQISASRLADHFRRTAVSIEANESQSSVLLRRPDGTQSTYQSRFDGVYFTQQDSLGTTQRIDRFPLVATSTVRWATVENTQAKMTIGRQNSRDWPLEGHKPKTRVTR